MAQMMDQADEGWAGDRHRRPLGPGRLRDEVTLLWLVRKPVGLCRIPVINEFREAPVALG